MIVFVDASAWIALVNRRDNSHRAATALLETLRQQRARLLTTTWVTYEALSLIKARIGPVAARTLWDRLANPAYVQLIAVDPTIEQAALHLFLDYDDKTWGVVDCASLVVMEQTSCSKAFAFDTHFMEASRQRGFSVPAEP